MPNLNHGFLLLAAVMAAAPACGAIPGGICGKLSPDYPLNGVVVPGGAFINGAIVPDKHYSCASDVWELDDVVSNYQCIEFTDIRLKSTEKNKEFYCYKRKQ